MEVSYLIVSVDLEGGKCEVDDGDEARRWRKKKKEVEEEDW